MRSSQLKYCRTNKKICVAFIRLINILGALFHCGIWKYINQNWMEGVFEKYFMLLHLTIEYAQHLVGRQGQNCTSLLSQCNNEDRLKEMDMNCYFKGYLLTFFTVLFSPAVQLEIVQQISLTLSSQKLFELLFFISSLKSSNFILKIIGIYTHYKKSFNP